MAGFDFGGIMSSIANLNFVFGGAKSMPDQKIDDMNEPAVLDDILRSNFNGDIYKNDMMDFFAPSLTTTDDILDKLIQELDKDQEAESIGQSFSSLDQDGSTFGNINCHGKFESSSISPFSVDSDQTIFDKKQCYMPTTSDASSYAFNTYTSNQAVNTVLRTQFDQRAIDTQQYQFARLATPTCTPTNPERPCPLAPPTFCLDSAHVVPPLAETVEIEYSQEHSYATNVQQCNNNNGSVSVKAAQDVKWLSKDGAGAALNGRITSPFSSSGSIRNSFSSSDSFQSNQSKYSNKRSAGRQQQQHSPFNNINLTGCRRPLNLEKYEDEEEEDEYMDGDDNTANLISRSFIDGFSERGNGTWFKHGSKRRCKSQYGLPFSYTDLRGGEKYPLLMLSDEERLLCEKEGVKLPTKFPLTKQEERELRRVKRKIRNKLSAQESRRKKNEYITSLEDRVRACDRDNQSLRRQVEALSGSNKTLAEQLKRLQSSIGNGSSKQTVQAGTCLAVLLLSFALLVAPNNNLFGKQSRHDEKQFGLGQSEENLPSAENAKSADTHMGPNQQKLIFPSNTRTLLPHANDVTLGADDQRHLRYNVNVAGVTELDADPPSFYFLSGDGGGGGKRPFVSSDSVAYVADGKRLKTRHIEDRFAAVAKNEIGFAAVVDENDVEFANKQVDFATVAKNEIISIDESKAHFAENGVDFAAVVKGEFGFEPLVAMNGVDFTGLAKQQDMMIDFAAVVKKENVDRVSMVDTNNLMGDNDLNWYADLVDDADIVNVSSTPSPVPTTTTVMWRSNRRPIKAEEF